MRNDECQTVFEDTIAAMKDSPGEDHELTVNALCGLAKLFRVQSRFEESKEVYEEVLLVMSCSSVSASRYAVAG